MYFFDILFLFQISSITVQTRVYIYVVTSTNKMDSSRLDSSRIYMGNYHERLATFQHWPVTFLSSEKLAQSGFYYLGYRDEVRCAYCKVEIMRWVQGDDPFKDHKRWAPQCPFVKNYKSLKNICAKNQNHEKVNLTEFDKEDDKDIDNLKMCKVCFNAERAVCFVPCGHVLVCEKCSLNLKSCPMCRSKFSLIVKLYYS